MAEGSDLRLDDLIARLLEGMFNKVSKMSNFLI
jgi:hypothetical protein